MRVLLFTFLIALQMACGDDLHTKATAQVELMIDGKYDFTAIGEAVKNKQIVALGESSHGVGDFYTFKAELVKYLHEHHGFEVLAFEAGLGDLNLAYSHLDSLSGDELLNQTLFGNFRCEEVEPLFDYIKTTHQSDRPLVYTGFDNQMSSSFFTELIEPIVSEYNLVLEEDLEYALDGYRRWFRAGYYQDSLKYESEAIAFKTVVQNIQSIFKKNKAAIQETYNLSNRDFDFIEQTCIGFKRTVDISYGERHRGSEHRDAIMFDNFQWLMNTIFPEKKVIIWAHNGHIEQQKMYEYSFKWMGHFLNDTYREDYYALGLFAQNGTAYQQWGDTVITLNNTDTTMIESIMMESGHRTSFLDVSSVDTANISYTWINQSISAFENENGGVVSFVPKERFDGVVVIRNVKAPTY